MLRAIFAVPECRSGRRSVFCRQGALGARKVSLVALIGETAGVALVETALIAPFLALVVMGTVDTARYGAAKMKLQQAVNRGLEMSWMGGKATPVSDIQAQAAAQADLSTSSVTITQTLECGGTATTWTSTDCASGETARYTQIQISTNFTPSFALGSLAKMLGNANGVVPISATGVIRIQ